MADLVAETHPVLAWRDSAPLSDRHAPMEEPPDWNIRGAVRAFVCCVSARHPVQRSWCVSPPTEHFKHFKALVQPLVSGNLWEQLERVLTKTLKPELALTLLVNLGEQPESVAQLAATMRSSCMECI